MIGKTLSHYRIVEELGRGGMGIVYKAEDTKLDRTVAIKVLPPAALGSDDDRARFYREAKAAAQLHHPHIASVFEIDEAVPRTAEEITRSEIDPREIETRYEDSRPFIAMEFIDGQTLERRIESGPLKINECTRIATQIASGLKAAHEKGIVHRDIKAANVILDKDGTAKILDFGLAQTSKSTKLTQMGSTLGTIAFMSPEQARGEEVDHRTDLWSLGVILYEMVTGRSPFPGDYEQAVVYEILNQNPEPLTALRTGVPMELETVANKCLEKNPELRYPSAESLIVDLKRIDASSGVRSSRVTTQMSGVAPAPAPEVQPKPAGLPIFPMAIGGAALAVGLLLGWILFRSGPEQRPVIRTQLVLPDAVSPLEAAITPDDRSLFYVIMDPNDAVRRLARYDFASGSRETISRTDNARNPIVSPDGRWIAYQTIGTFEWWRVLAAGGEPVRIPNSESVGRFGAAFDPQGDLLISDTTWSLVRVSREGDRSIVSPSGQEGMTPYIGGQTTSPAGTFLALSDWIAPAIPQRSYILKNGDSTPVSVLDEAWIHTITTSGHALFTRGNFNLPQQTIAVPIDLKTGELQGDGVGLGFWSVPQAVSPSGLLVYEELSTEGTGEKPSQLFRVTDSGTKELLFTLPGASSQEIAVSSDGTMLAVNAGETVGGESDIYLVDLRLGTSTRLTQGGGYDVPTWGGNDNVLYFDHRLSPTEWTIMRRRADGSGTNERVMPEGVMGGGDPDITQDNSLMVYSSDTDDIWAFDFQADSSFVVVRDNVIQYKPDASPDGSFVVYVQDGDAYCGSVQVSAIRGSSEPIEISDGGCYPVWTHDGAYIYYQDAKTISRIPVSTDPVFNQLGPPEEVFSVLNSRPVGVSGSLFYDVAADGTLYVSHSEVASSNKRPIWVVSNWFEELNQIAPRSR